MGKGYVFSLDAFVAFSLILISVQTLIVMSSSPAGYYYPLLQANYLAHDTLEVMKVAKPPCNATSCPQQTYMEIISPYAIPANRCQGLEECQKWFRQLNEDNIPIQYSYAFYYDDLDGNSHLVYDASADSSSKHYGIKYQRVQASAQTYLLGYYVPLHRGDSPYCNVVCKGYDAATNDYKSPAACVNVPCSDVPSSNFNPGVYKVGMLRMVVWG